MTELTIELLLKEAAAFAERESGCAEPALFGVDNGKAIGTYLEQKFALEVAKLYEHKIGNSASGIDFPALGVDIKTTSIKQPQSSCPFRDVRQKIYGLGYHLLVFVYQKTDDTASKTACLNILHTTFVDASVTADFQITKEIRRILDSDGNEDDLVALFQDKALHGDEITHRALAEEVLAQRPAQGYLTISNALQWRLQYQRVIAEAGQVPGIIKVR